ncbi:MAG: acetyl-CoA carboxylase biotin carboxylase subunit [Eubacterium sp.]|nr:acetyl-CoA carboxylase biotin carboxylase subunit [Eubacterium sp.]
MFRRILVAARGEIAMRIIRCCSEVGIETVLVYAREDREEMPVQFCNIPVCIGAGGARGSYLRWESILQAAVTFRCEAVHPGYGFLAENALFAEACETAGVRFIGPSAEMIRRMGDKQSARKLMQASGVPCVPGSDGIVRTPEEAAEAAERAGYPVLLKASAGGGGRGMRAAESPEEIPAAFAEAKAEAESAFGDGSLYLEKLILRPRHIEVQILGDQHGNLIHLGERDCTMQRRNQKMLEESPARGLSEEQRRQLYTYALRAAKAVGYYSAGTVEFVMDQNGAFYFIEMNTRIQVEHPVTELVTGVDLISEQLRIAAGLSLLRSQDMVSLNGHAIECRINAEDPENGFCPSPGTVKFLHLPGGPGVRVETVLYQNCEISPLYDSLVAKIIVHAPGRLEAIRKMRMALEETIIDGVKTNIEFMLLLMYNAEYMLGRTDTSFIERNAEGILVWNRASRKEPV